jgi:signal transduction histidine kinase
MKLQFKLALYNAVTKVAIIVILGILILAFTRSISTNHIQLRLKEKRTKIIAQLSAPEISDPLAKEGNYTDYNLLHETYFTLSAIPKPQYVKEKFSEALRTIDDSTSDYQILTQDFKHNGKYYRLELGETLSTVDLLERTIARFTLLVLLIAVTITLIADLFFSKYLLSPFYKIIDEKINKVNDPIHFSYVPITTTTKDFILLDESISMLMNKLRIFILNQKEFIANVSHELLTPIAILSVRMENLLTEEQLSVEGENKVFANLKTLGRLKAIINSLLMISKIEQHQYLKNDEILVGQIVVEVVNELKDRLLMKALTLTTALNEEFVFKGNAALFTVLITNLLTNAIKYNVAFGQIAIIANKENGHFKLSISDTGIGMKAEEIERAFGRFEKLSSADEESHGLGLAIVKHIADFHGIEVGVSTKPNEGTTVTLKFPLG